MERNNREYRTGQGVPKKGEYLCQSGKRVSFNENDAFPVCPISGKDTFWIHENQ